MAPQIWSTLDFDHCEAAWLLNVGERFVGSLTVLCVIPHMRMYGVPQIPPRCGDDCL
jgi:hypothetical protein